MRHYAAKLKIFNFDASRRTGTIARVTIDGQDDNKAMLVIQGTITAKSLGTLALLFDS